MVPDVVVADPTADQGPKSITCCPTSTVSDGVLASVIDLSLLTLVIL